MDCSIGQSCTFLKLNPIQPMDRTNPRLTLVQDYYCIFFKADFGRGDTNHPDQKL